MRTKLLLVALAVTVWSLNTALVRSAEAPAPTTSSSAQAKIDRATAEKTALSRVPGGHIKEGELEKEHGRLVWSFDIQQAASPNITEVQVDAVSGKVVSVATETPADQAKEDAADAAKTHKKP